MDPAVLAAIAAVSVPMLTMLGYGLGQARWQGKVSQRLDTLEEDMGHARKSRKDLHDRVDDVDSTIALRLSSIDQKLADLVGQLKAKDLIR